MKSTYGVLLASFLIGFSGSAFAMKIQPKLGEKACLSREYSASHMKKHPGQALNALSVIIENIAANEVYDFDHRTVKVVGERDGKLWGNEAWCDYRPNGSVKCQIECDGGAFTLYPNKKGALFNVAKDYYFPLYVQGSDPENFKEEDQLSLWYEDEENRAYQLYPAEVPACEQVWDEYKAVDHGC
jgi:hypothetical protein